MNRSMSPLFDTKLFTRHLESAYAAMAERERQGLSPEPIEVAAL
jgi:predicted O-linked N-acetylglucosamine transferase (SPINDLY family)